MMVISSEKTTEQIVKKLGMDVTTLYSWVSTLKSNEDSVEEPNNAQLYY